MAARQRHPTIIIGLAAVSLLAGACGSSKKQGASTTAAAAPTTAAATTAAATSAPAQTTTASTAPKELTKAPGFDGTSIQLGVLDPLSGTPAVIGKELAAGEDVFWKYYNAEKGGIAGKYPVKIVLEDSLYDTTTTVQKYNKIKNDVVMVGQVMGTAPTLALLPLLKADNVVAAPASQDAIWVREQQLFPIIEPYQIDDINAADYMLNEGGGKGKKVCAVLQNDVYGEAGLEGVQFAADKMGFEIAAKPRFKVGDQDFTAQVNELKTSGCEIVFAVALPTEFGGILGAAATLGFAPQWVGQSPAWVDLLLATPLKDYMTKYVMIVSVGHEWGNPNYPAAVKYADLVKKYAPDQKPNYYFSFGFFQGQAEAQLLEKAVAMGSLDRDGIVAAMNSLDVLKFDDLAGDYGYGPPEKRDPSRMSTMFKVNPDAPFGLEALKYNFSSPAAESFVFPTESG